MGNPSGFSLLYGLRRLTKMYCQHNLQNDEYPSTRKYLYKISDTEHQYHAKAF